MNKDKTIKEPAEELKKTLLQGLPPQVQAKIHSSFIIEKADPMKDEKAGK
ncbi:MAG: hypothetical protein ACI4XL_03415 [Bacillus sp. (in: firmicutes)]